MRLYLLLVGLVFWATTWENAISWRPFQFVTLGWNAFKKCKWEWGRCTAPCGGGMQYAYKKRNQGWFRKCDMPTAPRRCNTQCCPRNGRWVISSGWSGCSVSCGGVGVRKREKTCVDRACGGKPCYGSSFDTMLCHNGPCPVNCEWSSWGKWSKCSLSCGGGTQHRARHHKVSARNGGMSCPGNSNEIQNCNTGCCPENCEWSEWGEWGTCSASCHVGMQERKRGEIIVGACGGDSCEGGPNERRLCYTGCCPTDCSWSDWGEWSHCSHSCGKGIQRRHRSKSEHASCGGKECSGDHYETQDCNSQCCAAHCRWGEWGEWSGCSKSCDLGYLTRYRNVSVDASCGGLACRGKNSDTEYCNAFCCSDQCKWDEWSEWSECSQTCGIGKQKRSRFVKIDPSCKVQRCKGLHHEEKNCTFGCCRVDCAFSQWSEWSGCSATCGASGFKSRRRSITALPECGGSECQPPKIETSQCNRYCFHNGTLNDAECQCRVGWEGPCCEDDVNECSTVKCMLNSECLNTYGSYECVCNRGFTNENGACVPLSACQTGDHDCDENAQCVSLDDAYQCVCKSGFYGNGTHCYDTDECELERKEFERINEEIGSAEAELTQVVDAGGGLSPLCHMNAVCRNTFGSYECVCDEGFSGNGTLCEDIDECLLLKTKIASIEDLGSGSSVLQSCHEYASCKNGPGSYDCDCHDGYYGDGFICTELDECESLPCKHGGECVNLINSYECNCKSGYVGPTCEEDVDECTSEDVCPSEKEVCVNTPGNYTCSCIQGLIRIDGTCQEPPPEGIYEQEAQKIDVNNR